MASKSIQGSQTLAKKIRSRRNELGFTIEEAAKRAGVGTKTWCRYEQENQFERTSIEEFVKH